MKIDVAQGDLPKQVGHKLVEVAEGALAESLERQPEARETAGMAEAMVSQLLSGGYLLLREQHGAQEAEAWLRKTLSIAAAAVRMSGSDAFVKIDLSIKDVPNRMARREAGPAPQAKPEPAPPPPCACAKDQAGRCADCVSKLAERFLKFFGIFREMGKFRTAFEDLCKACELDQLDAAIASIVPSILDGQAEPDEERRVLFAREAVALLQQMAVALGVREMPLTAAAWNAAAAVPGSPPP